MVSRIAGGQYEIKRKIGEGGIARIFHAIDKLTDNPVALKIPGEKNQIIYESLKKEYLFASTHHHPSLLKPHDIIFDTDRPIIITPFIDGLTVDKFIQVLRNYSKTESHLSAIRKIFATILEAAQFIHFSGYCYNDFKPSNIMACGYKDKNYAPEVVLIDFNLISAPSDKAGRRGTLQYLAPEVILGYKSSRASDIYSIGVLYYRLLTGALPFDSENESELIERIAETGQVDSNIVPECFRQGLDLMLNRDPQLRPPNARQAARALKVDDLFCALEKSRMEYYLDSGPAPFAADLKKKFDSFRKFNSGRLFIINGYSYSDRPLDFLEAQYRIEGIDCLRIYKTDDHRKIDRILQNITSADDTRHPEKILLIDDLESLGNENSERLGKIIMRLSNIHTVAAGGRWFRPHIRYEIFDPIDYWGRTWATEVSLKAFLKRDQIVVNPRSLCQLSGGDPEQIFNYLRHTGRKKGLEYLMVESCEEEFYPETVIPENECLYGRMIDSLSDEQLQLISMLAAWGNSIPLLMFVKFESCKQKLIEAVTQKGILTRHKDSVSFLSGGLRKYIYGRIPDSTRKEYHKFWALNAEELISNNGERLELTAYHWNLSGDLEQAYRFNASAAKEFYQSGDYLKAGKYAEMLLDSGISDPVRRISAFKINGDINRAMGYINTARKMYIDILLNKCDIKTKGEIYRELGKLYLLSGNYDKSIYYTKRSRDYFNDSKDDKNLSECNDIITLAMWNRRDYLPALENLAKTTNKGPAYCQGGKSEYLSDNKNDMYNIMKDAFEISKSRKNPRLMVRAHLESGQHYLTNGDFEKGLGQFKKALEISEKAGIENDIIESLINLGSCHLNSGDLFAATDCFQNARQGAESSCNIYLKTKTEIKLADVSMEMGNFALALEVITAIERDRIYNEDKLLRLDIDLRKARLCLAMGDSKTSFRLAEQISRSAGIMKKQGLALRAEMVAAESRADVSGDDNIENLKVIFSKVKKYNLTDLVAELQLSLGKYYMYRDNLYNALYYFEDLCEVARTPKRIKLEAEIHRTGILAERDDYEAASEKLVGSEIIAAASGFIPIAFQATKTLCALHHVHGRIDLCEECNYRADGYLGKLLSAFPKGYPAEKYRRKLTLTRFTETAPTKMVKNTRDKESSAVKVS